MSAAMQVGKHVIPDTKIIARILAKVRVDGECWFFSGATDEDGYPHIKFAGKRQCVHRLMAAVFIDDLNGWDVHHTCGNPSCVNPLHLKKADPEVHRTDHLKFANIPF